MNEHDGTVTSLLDGYHNLVDIMKNVSYTIISRFEGEQSYEMSVLWSREYQSY